MLGPEFDREQPRWGKVHQAVILDIGEDDVIVDALSRKWLLTDPWFSVTGRVHVGQVVEGTVTKVVDFETLSKNAQAR